MTSIDMFKKGPRSGEDRDFADPAPEPGMTHEAHPAEPAGPEGAAGDVDRMLSDFLLELNRLSDALGLREDGPPGDGCAAPAPEGPDEAGRRFERQPHAPLRYRNIDVLLMDKVRCGDPKARSADAPASAELPASSEPSSNSDRPGLRTLIRGLFRPGQR